MNPTLISIVSALGLALLTSCENTVTEGPTTRAPQTGRTTTTTTVVEEPQPVDIATKPGSQNQNSLPHGQPDQPSN